MADLRARLQNPNFQRWVKCALALQFARSACLEIVENVIRNFHCEVTQTIQEGQSCSRCDRDTAASCRRNVCNKIIDEVILHSRLQNIPFHNIDMRRWQHNHWEIAKCFIPASGYRDKNSALKTDFTGIISIIINYKGFQNYVKSDLSRGDNIFRKVRQVRNRIMHMTEFELSEEDMRDNCYLIISMLQDFKTIDTAETVSKIVELQQATNFDPFNVRSILEEAAEALVMMKQNLDESIKAAQNLLNEATEDGVAKIQEVAETHVRGLDNQFNEAHMEFLEICRETLLHIVSSHIQNQKPNYASVWNHKTFLDFIRNGQGMELMLHHHKEVLYPSDEEPADVSEWDLSLLAFILTIPCRRSVNKEIVDFVNKLKVVRDSILGNKEIQMESLEQLVTQAPETLQAKMQEIIERDSRQISRETPPKDILKNWLMNDIKIDLKRKTQDNTALEFRVQSLEERFTRLIDVFHSASLEVQSRINETENRTYVIVRPDNLPLDRHAELVDLISPDTQPEILYSRLNQEIAPSHVESIGVGCIILEITCPTVKSLFSFWKQCISGKVLHVFDSIKGACRERLKCDSLEFEILLTETEMERCFNIIEYTYTLELNKRSDAEKIDNIDVTNSSDGVELDRRQIRDQGLALSHHRMETMKTSKPICAGVTTDTISLQWEVPKYDGSKSYLIRYKEKTETSWKYFEQLDKAYVTVEGLTPGCSYIFQVRAIHDNLEGPYSAESDEMKTRPSLKKVLQPAIVRKEDGPPLTYYIQGHLNEKGTNVEAKTRKIEIGKKPTLKEKEKTVLLVGNTEVGKSRMVNWMVNYVAGISWKDAFRFNLQHSNDRQVDQAQQDLDWITCTTIYSEGSRLDYQLNIVDTPGFENSPHKDDKLIDRLERLFKAEGEDGLLYIDAVCFTIKAADEKLSKALEGFYKALLKTFREDIVENICIFFTYADDQSPKVLKEMKNIGIPTNVYYSFNNNSLFADNVNTSKFSISQLSWDMGTDSLQRFFKFLETVNVKSLQHERPLLLERQRLEAVISGLQPKIDAGLNKFYELREEIMILRQNKEEILANKTFEYKVEETRQIQTQLPAGRHMTTCLNCNRTCHENCSYGNDETKKKCCVMDTEGNCTVCDDKCSWQHHHNTKYTFSFVTEMVKRKPYSVLKFADNPGSERMILEKALEKMETDIMELYKSVGGMIETINRCSNRLKEIIRQYKPLALADHIDLLLKREDEHKREGYRKRIEILQTFKNRKLQSIESEPVVQGFKRQGDWKHVAGLFA